MPLYFLHYFTAVAKIDVVIEARIDKDKKRATA